MDNGTEIQAFVANTAQILDGMRVTDYFAESLPSTHDLLLGNVIGRFMEQNPEGRMTIQSGLSQRQRSLFGIFGHRMATLGSREESRERLYSGLVAVTIANYEIPERRNVEVGLAVFHHVARKLGINTVDLFDEAAGYGSGEIVNLLREYGRRSDVTLKKYGWRELRTTDGLKYKFSYSG